MTLGDRIAVLRAGRLQQCGTPTDVYGQPANRFVAGFIGTPSMNFIEGCLSADGGQIWFGSPTVRVPISRRVAGSQQLPEPASIAGCPPGAVGSRLLPDELDDSTCGSKVVLGIRPEHLRLQPALASTGQAAWTVTGTVEVVEPLGSMMDLHVAIAGGQRLVCRVSAEPIECDSELTLYVDVSKAHLFAADDVERATVHGGGDQGDGGGFRRKMSS